VAERELWSDSWMYRRISGWEGIVEVFMDVNDSEWLRGSCGNIVGCTAGRVAERELWSDIWITAWRVAEREFSSDIWMLRASG